MISLQHFTALQDISFSISSWSFSSTRAHGDKPPDLLQAERCFRICAPSKAQTKIDETIY